MAQTVLITGASSGIGLELAKIFARQHYNLVLIARDHTTLSHLAKELSAVYGVVVSSYSYDLSIISSAHTLFQTLMRQNIGIDILINNAGFATVGPFLEASITDQLGMIQVNVTTLTNLSWMFGREMAKRKQGKILNVASVAAFSPGPYMAVYYATKTYVLSFSQALAEELKGSGVSVTALCPGPTKTEFQKRAGLINNKFFRGPLADPARVAQQGYDGLMSEKRVVVTGLLSKLYIQLRYLVPKRAQLALISRLHT